MINPPTRPLFRLARSYSAQALDGQWLSLKNRIWVLIALAVGLGLRVNQLGAQSLWNDEGTSVAVARTSIPAIISAAASDIHPPLYYILLSAWIQVAGIPEFALRYLSVLAAVLLIAVTFRIAREFFDQDVAVIAAVLSAFNPFQIYYAQETRMYIWVALFAALSVWAMVLLFKPPRSRTFAYTTRRRAAVLVLYILTTLAALYTNYYAFTLGIFENLAFVAWFIWSLRERQSKRLETIAFWVIGQLVIVLAYLPWLGFARGSLTSWPGISEPMSLIEMAWRIVSAFTTGSDAALEFQIVLVAAYIVFFIGGLLPSRDLFRQGAWGIVTGAVWALVPFLSMYVLSLARPSYNPKFLLLATPGFLIVVARGVSVLYPGLFLRERAPYGQLSDPVRTRLARQYMGIIKLLVGGLFAAGMVFALQNLFTDPRLQRDDYRGIVNYINAVATANDAVIVNAPGQLDVVRYYYHSPAKLVGLPVGRPMNTAATLGALNDLSSSQNIYGIFWATDQADPGRYVEGYLAQERFKASDDWHGDVRLTQYASAPLPELTPVQAGARFGTEIQLESVQYPQPPRVVSDFVPLEMTWRALQLPQLRYKVFAQLLDGQGRLVSQRDTEPRDGFLPTDQWTGQAPILDRLAIPIPPGLSPGEYHVIVGLYRADSGVRLPVSSGGDFFTVGNVQVARKTFPRDAFFFTGTLSASFGLIDVLGYGLGQPPHLSYARGDSIPLVLYFQANEASRTDVTLYAQLRDQGDNIIASVRAFENYPSSRWDKDEIVRDVDSLQIPSDALPGEYKIVVTDGTQTFDISHIQVR